MALPSSPQNNDEAVLLANYILSTPTKNQSSSTSALTDLHSQTPPSPQSSHHPNADPARSSSDSNLTNTATPLRKSRIRSIEIQSPLKHVASSERVRRNTDSMLEDAFIADRLKRRLTSRRVVHSRRTIEYTDLSDFIVKSIMEGGRLDAISAALPTDASLSNAVELAFRACMAGYFDNLDNESLSSRVKCMFMESLQRMELEYGELICKREDRVDKLFVIEEGMVEFSCGGQVAGTAGVGSILGELSLIYGILAPADVKCITPCVILWYMDALAFRRIQALIAEESLKHSSGFDDSVQARDCRLDTVRRSCSSFLDLQEQVNQSMTSKIPLDRLKKIGVVGRGTFGLVYVVKDDNADTLESPNEQFYSLKCMTKSSIVQRENQKRVLIEKHALQASCASPFVITLLGTYQDKNCIYFLTDFVQGGNLMRYMIKRDVLTHEECVFFAANIVSGLAYLHCKGFVHRDIKPENCLIGSDGYLKLCDFGMAKRLPSTVQLPSGGTEVVTLAFTMCGTPEFMSPEFVLSIGYNKSIDWWALGCILVEMYSGRSPFEFDGDLKKTFKEVCLIGMGRETYTPPNELRKPGLENAFDMTRRLLSKASDRIGRHSCQSIMEHKYFESIDFKKLRDKLVKAPYIPKLAHKADMSHFDVDDEEDEEEGDCNVLGALEGEGGGITLDF
jgi:serine/threonine protein kinase